MQLLSLLTTVPKRRLYYAGVIAAAGLCVITVLVWQGHNRPQAAAEAIPFVRTLVIAPADRAQGYTYSGSVRGRYESRLAFQAAGKIIKRNVELGSTVNAGDVLMQLDPKDLQQTVNSGLAQVAAAESQLRLAESNVNRYRQLFVQNAISQSQLDQYETAYEVALAAVRQASALYTQGSNQLAYSLLYADKPGVIASISSEAGQVVNAGQTVLTIVQDGEREVEINIPENRIEQLQKAAKLRITFWALPALALDGEVREIAPIADATARTFQARIRLINPPAEVKLGMTAAVAVADSVAQQPVTIPLAAIYQTGEKPAVWVVSDNKLILRPIETGKFSSGSIEIIDGLQQGDRIVIAGVHKLTEGQQVKINGDIL
ncbi:efflux RND transporter periplasmic adaptor subunit [Sporomusa aerivorans]|uniref:efflux RND transporter periplasmic adaptor subunit n=1 Tax=Sporomusa aerivorans TaxID=204936 RepID=UPI00352B2F33